MSLAVEERLGRGVGTELHKMIPDFLESKGCACANLAKKMNIWGPEGCEKKRQRIVKHLVIESNKKTILNLIPKSATRMTANKLLTEAIKRAKQQLDDSESQGK